MREAAEAWFALRQRQVDDGAMSPNSLAAYRSAYRLHVLPALGELRLREVTVARCEVWQERLRDSMGAARRRSSRAVLSGVMAYSARMGAVPTNPVRDISPITGGPKRRPRAMTADERARWLEHMERSERARRWDLPDLTRLMLGTGCRIGEVLALTWDDVDLDAGTVAVRHHLTRVKGEGLVRAVGTKRGDGRLLRVPRWCVDVLLHRRIHSEGAWPVLPDSLGGWRDPSNTLRVLRAERDAAGMGWVTTHVFRKTVLTVLDEAKLTPRQLADHAGHADPSMTLRAYMGRDVETDEAAEALEGAVLAASSSRHGRPAGFRHSRRAVRYSTHLPGIPYTLMPAAARHPALAAGRPTRGGFRRVLV
ncbi:MAG: tyrosine-type recombinase/integrase [Pseudonocardia sp.]